MKSKKVLFAALDTFFGTDRYSKFGLKAAGIGNETYGNESMIYVTSESLEQRRSLENFLENQGFKVKRNYASGSTRSEIQVSYFRGRGWNF